MALLKVRILSSCMQFVFASCTLRTYTSRRFHPVQFTKKDDAVFRKVCECVEAEELSSANV